MIINKIYCESMDIQFTNTIIDWHWNGHKWVSTKDVFTLPTTSRPQTMDLPATTMRTSTIPISTTTVSSSTVATTTSTAKKGTTIFTFSFSLSLSLSLATSLSISLSLSPFYHTKQTSIFNFRLSHYHTCDCFKTPPSIFFQ